MHKTIFPGVLIISILSAPLGAAGELAEKTYTSIVNKSGDIALPSNFRQQWDHLGSWIVADPKAPGHGFHDVYSQPEAVQSYKSSGSFPDGAVLVKEIRKPASEKLSTGLASWAADPAVWFVMVKDRKDRFKNNTNWGDGWGWALFEPKNTAVNASKGYKESCLNCHLPAKRDDWVYIKGYPTLQRH